jgi:hypothetical protein
VFSQIFEPYLLLGLIVGALFALVARRRLATILVIALVVAWALRYGLAVDLVPGGTAGRRTTTDLMTWNRQRATWPSTDDPTRSTTRG